MLIDITTVAIQVRPGVTDMRRAINGPFVIARRSCCRSLRSRSGRKPIDENHPRIEMVHDIPDEEKQCGYWHELEKIGEEVSERIQVLACKMHSSVQIALVDRRTLVTREETEGYVQ